MKQACRLLNKTNHLIFSYKVIKKKMILYKVKIRENKIKSIKFFRLILNLVKTHQKMKKLKK